MVSTWNSTIFFFIAQDSEICVFILQIQPSNHEENIKSLEYDDIDIENVPMFISTEKELAEISNNNNSVKIEATKSYI